jgi:peptidoglycan hydrolase CwlO-like protein
MYTYAEDLNKEFSMYEADKTVKDNSSNTKWIVFIVVALIVGGALGFVIGGNAKETEIVEQYDQQITKLETELANTGEDLSAGITEGQEAVAEGQQTLETLQAENATLNATIETLNEQIADLESQLEDSQNTENSTN